MQKSKYYIINAITLYRLIAAPVLLILIITKQYDLFKWLLPVSFFTDLIDGYLARKFKVSSSRGAILDSIADDANMLIAIIGLFVFKFDFIKQQEEIIFVVLGLFAIQMLAAFIRYKKITSFHTYLAKAAAVFQGCFFILAFLLPQPIPVLFYITVFITSIELIEEIIIVMLLPKWEADVKGLYWIINREKNIKN